MLNTPSHHRVHHGANQQYLDKNYGGILIVWDKLFGTFEPEVRRIKYGLTKNIRTFNPIKVGYHEFVDIARDVRGAGSRARSSSATCSSTRAGNLSLRERRSSGTGVISDEFAGRVVLVTGSSSGIGEQIARRFSALGATVVVNSSSSVEAGPAGQRRAPRRVDLRAGRHQRPGPVPVP